MSTILPVNNGTLKQLMRHAMAYLWTHLNMMITRRWEAVEMSVVDGIQSRMVI